MQHCKVLASGMTSVNIEVIAKPISYISLKQITKLKSLLPNIIITKKTFYQLLVDKLGW